jgi:hypothetical protein
MKRRKLNIKKLPCWAFLIIESLSIYTIDAIMASTPSGGEQKALKVKNLLASYYETDQEPNDASISNSSRFVVWNILS